MYFKRYYNRRKQETAIKKGKINYEYNCSKRKQFCSKQK